MFSVMLGFEIIHWKWIWDESWHSSELFILNVICDLVGLSGVNEMSFELHWMYLQSDGVVTGQI